MVGLGQEVEIDQGDIGLDHVVRISQGDVTPGPVAKTGTEEAGHDHEVEIDLEEIGHGLVVLISREGSRNQEVVHQITRADQSVEAGQGHLKLNQGYKNHMTLSRSYSMTWYLPDDIVSPFRFLRPGESPADLPQRTESQKSTSCQAWKKAGMCLICFP